MLGALFTTGCANMMLFFATQSFSGWMVESMIRVASDTVFVTSMRGCLSDVLKGPELTVSAARVATYAGIGVCLGPILASRVIMPLISRRYTFVMNACREIVILSPICVLSVSLTPKVSLFQSAARHIFVGPRCDLRVAARYHRRHQAENLGLDSGLFLRSAAAHRAVPREDGSRALLLRSLP